MSLKIIIGACYALRLTDATTSTHPKWGGSLAYNNGEELLSGKPVPEWEKSLDSCLKNFGKGFYYGTVIPWFLHKTLTPPKSKQESGEEDEPQHMDKFFFYTFQLVAPFLCVAGIAILAASLKFKSVMPLALPMLVATILFWLLPFIRKKIIDKHVTNTNKRVAAYGAYGAFAGVAGTATGITWQLTAAKTKRTWDEVRNSDTERQRASLRSHNDHLRSRLENMVSGELPSIPDVPATDGDNVGALMNGLRNTNDATADTGDYLADLFAEKAELEGLMGEHFSKIDMTLMISFAIFLALFITLALAVKFLKC